MEVFWYLRPTLTGYINHGPYMSELNPVLVPAVAAIQSLHWEFFFSPNTLHKGWESYLSVCLPVLLPTQPTPERWRAN